MVLKISRGRIRDVVSAPCIPLTEGCLCQTGNTNNGGDGMILKISREESEKKVELVLFDYRLGRGREGPDDLLKVFQGYLQTDGYNAPVRLLGKLSTGKKTYFLRCFLI